MAPGTEPAAPADRKKRGRVSVRALSLLAGLAVVVYALDQGVKILVTTNMEVGEVIPVLGPVLQLHYVLNPGAAFSLGSGYTWILSLVAVAVIGFIVWFARRIHSLAWATMFGLVLGGAIGNATDRLFREPGFGVGHVVDMFQIIYFPAIFNVADMAIVGSMGLFILLSLRGIGLDGSRTPIVQTTKKHADAVSDAPAPKDPA